MGLTQGFTARLVTWCAVFFLAVMVVGMGVMAVLMAFVDSFEGMLLGGLLVLALFFPVGLWIIKRVMQPVLDTQRLATQLLKQSNREVQGQDDFSVVTKAMTDLASHTQERLHALESERTKVSSILDSMVEGVIALDLQGRIMVMNPAAHRILDIHDTPVEGRPLLEVVRNRGLADLLDICQSLEPHKQYKQDVELQLPVYRTLEVNARPVPFSGRERGIVLVMHDITELRRLEGVRAEFVANVSHEVRTPLTAIKGYLETLLDETPSESTTHRRFLEVAHNHAERLGRLINDLLNLSDIETGKVVLQPTPINLHHFIAEILAIFEKDVERKGVRLLNHVPEDLSLEADRDRLSQIFVNLVDNAVKYTAQGGQVMVHAEGHEHTHIRLRVTDTGQGIPVAEIPRITERFYRVDKARSREEGGTGLGLAIVKHLVQLHGGALRIESELGKGTTIEVTLPATQLVHAAP